MKRFLAALLLALVPAVAWADSQPAIITFACGASSKTVYSVGAATPPVIVTSGVIGASQTFGAAAANCGTAQIRSNAGTAMTDTLAAPGTVGANWYIYFANGDSTATDTVTPASGTISGAASLAIAPGQNALIASDGTNFFRIGGNAGSSSGGSVNISAGTGITVSPSPITGTGTVSLTSPVSAANGGTGAASPTAHGVMVAEGSSAMTPAGFCANGLLLWPSTSGDPACATTLPASYAFTGTPTFSNPLALGSSTATTQTAGDNSTKVATTAYVATAVSAGSATVLRDYIAGLTLSNDGTSPNTVIDISAGQATDSTNVKLMTLAAFTKTTAAFATGTGNGGLDTGTVAASTWYHMFVISNAAGTTFDALISKSATAPTMPSGFALFRRIGSILTNSSSQILAFVQDGQTFYWGTQVLDLSSGGNGTTTARTLITLSVPPGVKVRPLCRLTMPFGSAGSGGLGMIVTSPDEADVAPTVSTTSSPPLSDMGEVSQSGNTAYLFGMNLQGTHYTNTSAQIGVRVAVISDGNINIDTRGWIDDRGIYN